MQKALYTIAMILSLSLTVVAGPGKTSSLSGTVVDVFGEPVVGAKVILKESKQIVYTDFDGKFIFKVQDGSTTIEVSMVSFEQETTSVQVNRKNSQDLSIKLKSK